MKNKTVKRKSECNCGNILSFFTGQKGGCNCGLSLSGGKKIRKNNKTYSYPNNSVRILKHNKKYGGNTNNSAAYPVLNVINKNPYTSVNMGYNGGKKGKLKGGHSYSLSNSHSYPDGLVGNSWNTNIGSWPGVDGINGNRNFLPYNKYEYDPQTENIIQERSFPFYGGKKRGLNKTKQNNKKYHKKKMYSKKHIGGMLSQDLVNLQRQIMYNASSVYNGFLGYDKPVNPMPYKDQFLK